MAKANATGEDPRRVAREKKAKAAKPKKSALQEASEAAAKGIEGATKAATPREKAVEVLKSLKVDKALYAERLPTDVLVKLAEFLGGRDRGQRSAIDERTARLSRLVPMTESAREKFEDLDGKRKRAKSAFEASLEEEHKIAKEIAQIDAGTFQERLPLGPQAVSAKPEAKKGKGKKKGGATEKVGDVEIGSDVIETTIQIIESCRKKKKGIGPTSLARQLFGSANADLKTRARLILEELAKKKLVAKVEGKNKEPSFWALDPKEAKSADNF